MDNSDKGEFKKIMCAVGEVYDKNITVTLLATYFNAMREFTIEQVSWMFEKHLKNPDNAGTFFPKPADLIRQLTGTSKQQERDVEEIADMAWQCVIGELKRVGAYQPLELEDKVALAALKGIGGWKMLGNKTYDELNWIRKQFVSAYVSYQNKPIDQLPSKLPGLQELSEHKANELGALSKILNSDKLNDVESAECTKEIDGQQNIILEKSEQNSTASQMKQLEQKKNAKNWIDAISKQLNKI
jgi:hypothetical protein